MAREPTAAEKEKIAAGPRFDPGEPKKRWRPEPEPKPPTLEPVIPQPPPKPAPPTLEPVIPQPYIEPKDAKVVSTDAKGNPTILETPDGKKHYTPFQTTMWGELGFKTDKEYLQSQRTGQPSQYVGITKGVEKPVRVSRAELAKASRLKGEKQFEAFREIGAIPFGSKFLPGPGGFQGTDWNYIDPKTIKKYKGQLIARLARASVKKPRVVIPPLEVRPAPPYREERPVPIEVKRPAYLKGRRAFRELQTAAKKPTLENIQGIIDEWKKSQEWWTAYQDLHPATIKAGFKREFEGTAGKEYMGKLETYNSQVIAYNLHIENFDKIAADLDKEGKALGIGRVEKYNDEMVRLNALTLSWEREAVGINLENEAAVRLHNQKLANIRRDYDKLAGRVGAINTVLLKVNAFNAKIDKFNANLAKLVDPGEPPAEPLKTVGNIGAAIYDGIKREYKKAASIEGTLVQKVGNVGLLTAELIVPGVWIPSPYFGKDIKDRTPGDIALNVGLDLFVLLPVARTATIFIRQALGTTAKGTIKLALKAEAKLVKDAVKAMRLAYGKGAAQALKEVSRLQAIYIKRLAKLERMKVKPMTPGQQTYQNKYWQLLRLKDTGKITKQEFFNRLKALEKSRLKMRLTPLTRQQKATLRMENKLQEVSRNFVNEVRNAQTRLGKKGVVGAGFDSPEVAKAFYRMPEEIVRHTKGALQAIRKAKPKPIKQLKADVAKAEARLQAAKEKTTWDAAQWADLVEDLIEKQAILSQRTAGGLAKLQQELIRVQQQLSRVRARMKAPRLRAKQRRALKLSELNLERQLSDLTQKLHAGIRAMEIEWGRGGVIMGGGGRTTTATAIRPRTAPTSTAATVRAPTTATMTAERVAAHLAITAAVVKIVGKPIPEVEAITKGLTDVEVIRAVEKATIKAIKAAERLATKPSTKVKLDTKQKLALGIAEVVKASLDRSIRAATNPRIKGAIKAKTLPITKAAVKVGVKVAEKVARIPIPKPKLIPRLLPRKTDKEKRKIIRAAKGAIAWRHGELKGKDVFHVGLFPYTRQSDYLTVVGKKPQNATIVKGPGSARQSIKLLYGKEPPRAVRGDIGFFDFHITPTGPKRVDITFKPDPQLQTTSDIRIGRRMPRITPKTPRLRR